MCFNLHPHHHHHTQSGRQQSERGSWWIGSLTCATVSHWSNGFLSNCIALFAVTDGCGIIVPVQKQQELTVFQCAARIDCECLMSVINDAEPVHIWGYCCYTFRHWQAWEVIIMQLSRLFSLRIVYFMFRSKQCFSSEHFSTWAPCNLENDRMNLKTCKQFLKGWLIMIWLF